MKDEGFRAAPVMLHSINLEGKLVDISDAWLDKLGYTREEVLGRSSTDFLTEESRRYAREVVLPGFFATGRCNVEYEMVTKAGQIIPVRLRGSCRRDAAGDIVSSIAAIEDLTEQRQLEKKMLQTQKLESLGLMAGGIAHDFNNLLVSILGNAQLTLESVRSSPDIVDCVTDIMTAARRASELCRQLLAYSGKGRVQDEEIDVSEMIRDLVQVLDVSVGKEALIKLDLAKGLHVVGDVTQLRQILMNLVINAGESLEGSRGMISIATSLRDLDGEAIGRSSNTACKPGRFICIEVADTGSGIPAQLVDKIFDPFFTTKAKGHGLGLAAVHGIVRAHLGTLTLYSVVGRGTSIKVFLPPAHPIEDRPAPTNTVRGMVLIVDDDESVRKTLARLLSSAGFSTVTAASGDEALLITRARGEEVLVFLVDVSMPGMDGPALFTRLRALLPDAAVVLMSGYNHVDTVRTCAAAGLLGFLQKPFMLEAFIELADKARAKTR